MPESAKAEAAVAQAEEALAKGKSVGRRAVGIVMVLVVLALSVITALAAWTLYEIHSCVTPGWPCNTRSAEQTAEIVVDLNEGHIEIEGDIDDIKQMLREIRAIQEEK